MSVQEDDGSGESKPGEFGPCCICETQFGINNVLMLGKLSPTPGRGWGCVVCGLPPDGAIAVLCDGCMELIEAGDNPIFVCKGWPKTDGRVRFEELSSEPFGHDKSKHPEECE